MAIRTRYRTSQVIIDAPKTDGEILINSSVQKLDIDTETSEVVTEYPRHEFIHRIASRIATDVVTVYDPVIGSYVTISVAGLHAAIQANVVKWIMEEYPDTVLEGDLVWQS